MFLTNIASSCTHLLWCHHYLRYPCLQQAQALLAIFVPLVLHHLFADIFTHHLILSHVHILHVTDVIWCSLCNQIFTLPIQWTAAANSALHAIDFGPGGLSGLRFLMVRTVNGWGARVIVELYNGILGEIVGPSACPYKVSKLMIYLVVLFIWSTFLTGWYDTPFSQLLGKPPIIIAWMMPTTVKAGFVSTVLSAGYHVKLTVWIPDENQDKSVTHPHTITCHIMRLTSGKGRVCQHHFLH